MKKIRGFVAILLMITIGNAYSQDATSPKIAPSTTTSSDTPSTTTPSTATDTSNTYFDEGSNSDTSSDSQDDDLWYMDKEIADITFTGLKTLSKSDLDVLVHQFIGKSFNADLIRSLQDRLFSIDYFDDITPYAEKYQGKTDKVVLRLEVVERAKVGTVNIYGNSKIRDALIAEFLRVQAGSFFSEVKIKLDVESIKNAYIDKGYFDTEVAYTVVDGVDKTGNMVKNIEYNIKESGQTIVKAIEISGNENIKAFKIIGAMETKRKSPINSGTFKGKENFDLDKQKIYELYSKSGYIDAEVVDIQVSKAELTASEKKKQDKNNYIKITYYIKEGKVWTFNSINFVGNKIFDTKRFKPYINHKPGDIVNLEKINKILAGVQGEYANNGYIFSYIALSDKRDALNRKIDYTITIQEQGKGYIGDIVIRGNTKTKLDVIMREMEIKEGDMYDMSKLQKSIENLYNTQFFDAINPKPVSGRGNRIVDIVIDVEEKKTISSGVGGSFGGDPRFPVSGFVNWQDVNLAGKGYTLNAKVNLSWYNQEVSMEFVNPWLFNQRLMWSVDFGYSHQLGYSMTQDMGNPLFPEDSINAVPDPYKGYYVFQDKTTYKGRRYEAGAMFPDVPSIDDIDRYDLATDYSYNGGSYTLLEEDTMEYEEHNISFGSWLKYTFNFPVIKRFSPYIGQRFGFSYLTYKKNMYRPYSTSVLDANDDWEFVPKTFFGFEFDGRDIFYAPTKGYFFSQQGNFTYGRSTHYFQSDTELEIYIKLWDLKVSDTWSWKMVLAMHSDLSIMMPLGKTKEGNPKFEPNNDLLYTNGINVGRGWGYHEGEVLWNNWVELRMPLVESILWFDMYFEALSLTSNFADFTNKSYWKNDYYRDWYFGLGAGFRFTVPSFPIRIYIAKLFRVDKKGKAIWERGNIFYNKKNIHSGVNLIFSIGM